MRENSHVRFWRGSGAETPLAYPPIPETIDPPPKTPGGPTRALAEPPLGKNVALAGDPSRAR